MAGRTNFRGIDIIAHPDFDCITSWDGFSNEDILIGSRPHSLVLIGWGFELGIIYPKTRLDIQLAPIGVLEHE